MLARMRAFAIAIAISTSATAVPAQKPDFAAAAAFSEKNSGLAVLVYQKGKLIFERYQNGHKQDQPVHIFSGTKSFVPMVALIAEKDGLLKLDEKVYKTITEWKGDKLREKITIRHLLNLTSGLKNNDKQLHQGRAPDQYGASIACLCTSEPGTKFKYGSNHVLVFGELLKRKLQARQRKSSTHKTMPTDFVDYLKVRLLDRIDCRFDKWKRDKKGNPALSLGAHMTAREWGKFGQLILNRGRHKSRQIVPSRHWDECFVGSKAKVDYGLNFWLLGIHSNQRHGPIPPGTVAAIGLHKQLLIVMPLRKTVIVRFASEKAAFDERQFLKIMFGK